MTDPNKVTEWTNFELFQTMSSAMRRMDRYAAMQNYVLFDIAKAEYELCRAELQRRGKL